MHQPLSRPKLEALLWKHTHRDYRGVREDGTRCVLHLQPGEGTVSRPLSSFRDAELVEKLPRSVREEFLVTLSAVKVLLQTRARAALDRGEGAEAAVALSELAHPLFGVLP